MFNCPYLSVPKHILRQALLATIGMSRGTSAGCVYAFNAVLLYQLKYDKSFTLDSEQTTLITSVATFCMIVSSLLSNITIKILGRRGSMLLMDLVTFTAWLLIFYCENFNMMLAARMLLGTSMGTYYTILYAILGEIATPKYRTTIATIPPLGVGFGFFQCQFLRYYVHWKILGGIFAFLPLYNFVNALYLKESYVTHLDRGNIETARECFEWYRGTDSESAEEFNDILHDKEHTNSSTCSQMYQLCRSKAFLMPFWIIIIVYLVNCFSGIQAIVYCTGEVIKTIDEKSNTLHNTFLALSVVSVLALFSSIFLVKIFSVRFMVLSSGYLLSVSLLALGIFMYCSRVYHNFIFPILALVALLTNIILYCLGVGAFTTVICSEMFPQATRIMGISITNALSFLFFYLFAHFLPALLENVGGYWTMTMFGFCTFFGNIVLHLTLPKTQNKTLLEINKQYQYL